MSYFAALGEGELLSLHWEPIVLLQTGLVETHYTWNGIHPIEKGEKARVLFPRILPSDHLLRPITSPSTQPSQVPRYQFHSPQGRVARFCFPFCNHVATVCSLHWSGGHYSIYRSPYKLHPASLKWQPAKPVLTEPWNALNRREKLPSKIKWSGHYYRLARQKLSMIHSVVCS